MRPPLSFRKRLGFDVDEVLNIFHRPWIEWMNDGWCIDADPHAGFPSWDSPVEWLGPTAHEFIRPRIYDRDIVKPVDGALAAIQMFRDLGYDIYFVTSCPNNTAIAKQDWLVRHGFLPSREINQFLPMSDKSSAPVDVLIDDHIKNVVNFKNGVAVLIDRPHNANESWLGLRVPHVADLYPFLK